LNESFAEDEKETCEKHLKLPDAVCNLDKFQHRMILQTVSSTKHVWLCADFNRIAK
jgi:hypothetical protein